jgi:hypothetical protein
MRPITYAARVKCVMETAFVLPPSCTSVAGHTIACAAAGFATKVVRIYCAFAQALTARRTITRALHAAAALSSSSLHVEMHYMQGERQHSCFIKYKLILVTQKTSTNWHFNRPSAATASTLCVCQSASGLQRPLLSNVRLERRHEQAPPAAASAVVAQAFHQDCPVQLPLLQAPLSSVLAAAPVELWMRTADCRVLRDVCSPSALLALLERNGLLVG